MYSTSIGAKGFKLPEISIIMSVFNAEKTVGEAIQSILDQTYKNFEFIIIDDGSTDGSLAAMRKFDDPRIKILEQENRGLTKSLNRAVAAAAGKYLARMDADDVSRPQRLERQLEFMETRPHVAAAGTWADAVDDAGRALNPIEMPCSHSEISEALTRFSPIIHGSAIIRKDAFLEMGGYRDFFKASQDFDLWLRISDKYELANIPEKLYKLRESDANISVVKGVMQDMLRDLALEMKEQRRKYGKDRYDRMTPEQANENVDRYLTLSPLSKRILTQRKYLWFAETGFWKKNYRALATFLWRAVKCDPLNSSWMIFVFGFLIGWCLVLCVSDIKKHLSGKN